MSPPIRFLFLTVIGWTAVRAASVAMLPAAEQPAPLVDAVQVAGSTATAPRGLPAQPPVKPTEAPPPPLVYATLPPELLQQLARLAASGRVPQAIVYRTIPAANAQAPAAAVPVASVDHAGAVFFADIPKLEDWSLAALTGKGPRPPRNVPSIETAPPQPLPNGLQLTAWALVRGGDGASGLASGGTLGGSQAGARLTYRLLPGVAASLRTSSALGDARSGEVAAGLRLTPVRSVPIALTAERRQAVGENGRSAFAMFLEGGVYQRPIAWGVELDGYAQGGVVGFKRRDLFADGALTLTRPLRGALSIGAGVWGGAQPGIYRVDAGPRLSLRVRPNIRVHADWRQRVAGEAAPDSGPALSIGADF